MKRLILFTFITLAYIQVFSQGRVGISPTGQDPHSSAALDIVSPDKGLLIPRMNSTSRLAIPSPANGLLVYDTDSNCVFFFRQPTIEWVSLCQLAIGIPGPQGAVGPTGAIGPQGPAGAAGAVGPQGPAGAVGPQGTAGVAGAQGPAGANGAVGPQGPAGAAGAVGPQGPAGVAGVQGLAGANGAVGPAGPAGAVGAQGPAGANGAVGPQGPAGAVGPQGPAGPASALSCVTPNIILKSDGSQATCTVAPIFENALGNVGIGNSSPTERLDITGNLKFSQALMPNNNAGTTGQVLVSQGANTAPIWQSIGSVIQVLKSSSTRTLITSTSFTNITGLTQSFNLTTNATVMISTYGSLETTSDYDDGSGVIVQVFLDGVAISDMFQTIDINDAAAYNHTIAPWAMTNTLTLTPGNHTILVKARKYMGDDFYAGGNTTAPSPNEGGLVLTIIPQ